jgi:ferritin-like metal-binding protein YciE
VCSSDLALIGAAQRIEHYEIAAYGSATALASRLGLQEAAALLQDTLDEERITDARLTGIAETGVNGDAAIALHA